MVIKKSIERKSPESLREILVKGGGLWDALPVEVASEGLVRDPILQFSYHPGGDCCPVREHSMVDSCLSARVKTGTQTECNSS